MIPKKAQEILDFWFKETPAEKRFKKDETFDKKAFAQDHKTRLIVNDAVYAGYLEAMNESQRFFMILPLIHSEEITDHDMAYYLLNKYLREHEGYAQIKKFWQDHTKAIKQFHRYPHRNKILGRESTEEELAFLNGPNSSW
jgi:uncharacterized protein (DUF924 family)